MDKTNLEVQKCEDNNTITIDTELEEGAQFHEGGIRGWTTVMGA